MNSEALTLSLILGIGGFGFLLFTIQMIRGKSKTWWVLYSSPIVPGGAVYWGIPASVGIIITAVSLLLPTVEIRRAVFMIGWCTSIPMAFIFLMWHPRWLTPKWLLWIEDNHNDVQDLLLEEARKDSDWKNRVNTQEGLEDWVNDVRRKYGRLHDYEWKIVIKRSDLIGEVQRKGIERVIAENPSVFQKQDILEERMTEEIENKEQVASKFKVGIKVLGLLSSMLAVLWFWKRFLQRRVE